ncbi:MAG: hypothetical protein CUN55_10240 [Phototrophicales bacterium]|nr:MAG: hypothetical protein CUN55_10240 [Phototrophicales bacterium]
MRYLLSITLVATILLFSFTPAIGQADPTLSANWLNEQQAENGSFGNEVGATAFVLIALSSVEKENSAALEWLSTQDFSTLALDELSLSLIALVATNTDISSFADGELLANYSEKMRAEDVRADHFCLGLIARFVMDIAISQSQMDKLNSFFNEDGSVGITTNAEADVITTSLCIQALVASEQSTLLPQALAFLQSIQKPDGGWSIDPTEEVSDPLATAFVMQALIASEESFADWGNPERTLIEFADANGAFIFADGRDEFFNVISTAAAIPVFQGASMLSFAPNTTEVLSGSDAPTLNANWKLVGDGFQIELDTADDFFTTVVDPFTGEELYGIEIINWTAEYPYTGYIIEQYLTADIILWMAEQDASVLENISAATLLKMSEEELAKLPAEVQQRATNSD